MAENFTFLDFIKGIFLFLFITSITTILNDYHEINDLYVERQDNFAVLKGLNDELLAAYHIDLETDHPELYESMQAVEFSETYNKNIAPNTDVVKNYYIILYILFGAVILFRWIDRKSLKNKTTEEITENPVVN